MPNAIARATVALMAGLLVGTASAQLPETPPVPAAKPDAGGPPSTPPLPQERPVSGKLIPPAAAEAPQAAAPVRDGLSPAERLCRAELARLGARFKPLETISEPEGCAVANPISLETLSEDVAVEPPATVNCATALATARFLADTVAPASSARLGSPLKAIANASGYVCRPRAGTTTVSEHAYGNAIDISGFVLKDGGSIAVLGAYDDKEKAGPFLDELRKAACGPFKTVLGPGADADHADHLHLDLAHRRNGGTFCQ